MRGHLPRRHRGERARDPEILPQHAHRIDAAHRRRDREAHCVAERILDVHDALLYGGSLAAETLHPERRDSLPQELRQDGTFEAAEGCIEAIQRTLTGVEGVTVPEHPEVDLGI